MRASFQHHCERMKLELLLKQWDTQRNFPLAPDQISYGSKRKVWWQCEKGHNWQAAVNARTGCGTGCPVCAGRQVAARTMNGSGCPYCTGRKALPRFNDLATMAPDVAQQWHPTLNGTLTPQMVTVGSHRKVWWVCKQGHVWQAAIYSRTGPKKCGCPICAGRISKKKLMRYQTLLAEMKGVVQI